MSDDQEKKGMVSESRERRQENRYGIAWQLEGCEGIKREIRGDHWTTNSLIGLTAA